MPSCVVVNNVSVIFQDHAVLFGQSNMHFAFPEDGRFSVTHFFAQDEPHTVPLQRSMNGCSLRGVPNFLSVESLTIANTVWFQSRTKSPPKSTISTARLGKNSTPTVALVG